MTIHTRIQAESERRRHANAIKGSNPAACAIPAGVRAPIRHSTADSRKQAAPTSRRRRFVDEPVCSVAWEEERLTGRERYAGSSRKSNEEAQGRRRQRGTRSGQPMPKRCRPPVSERTLISSCSETIENTHGAVLRIGEPFAERGQGARHNGLRGGEVRGKGLTSLLSNSYLPAYEREARMDDPRTRLERAESATEHSTRGSCAQAGAPLFF